MFDWVSIMPLLTVKNKEINYVMKSGRQMLSVCKHPIFRNIKQTLHYTVAIE